MKKLVIFGIEDYAEIVCEYFQHDSEYEVVGFTVNREYMKDKEYCGLPVVPFEDVETCFPPETHDMHVAIVYYNLNRDRARICAEAKARRYSLASYISSKAFVWHNVKLGEHCFIFENNVLQPFAEIGDNCILWSGNHIGHSSKIGSNVFISSHVVISGHCVVGNNCFLGVNSTMANGLTLGKESWVMPCAYIGGDIAPNSMVKSAKSASDPLNERALRWALEAKRK